MLRSEPLCKGLRRRESRGIVHGMGLRETFDTIDVNVLRSWVANKRQEDLHLEFKRISAELPRDDRKNFATCASGFANSEGGIVVWGVDARQDETGVDAAHELKPIENSAAALSKLQTHTAEATSPIVDGLLHREVLVDANRGVLVTLVPPSDSGPHMAGLGEGRYYKRSGASFYRMEHFDIADMFGRRACPSLALSVQLEGGGASQSSAGRAASLRPIVAIVNSGRGIARFPLVRLLVSSPHRLAEFGLDGNGRIGLPKRPRPPSERSYLTFAGGVDDVVHPGTELQLTTLEVEVSEHDTTVADLVVQYELACEGLSATRGETRVGGLQLLEFARQEIERCFPKGEPR